MLAPFDWLRRSRTGAELIATARYFAARPDAPIPAMEIGPPPSALASPCQRCWIYARQAEDAYCAFCRAILNEAWRWGDASREATVIWGYVNRLPKAVQDETPGVNSRVFGVYRHDAQRFLLVMHRRGLKPWLQTLLLYHGVELTGLLQVFPTVGIQEGLGMGDLLCRAVHYETVFPLDRLRARYYAAPYQLLKPRQRDRQGLLDFGADEFLRLLEMATVFRSVLHPDKQRMLHELLQIDDPSEEGFYWGRFLGYLSATEKDMLNAWKIRGWPKARIRLLYELIDYVGFVQVD